MCFLLRVSAILIAVAAAPTARAAVEPPPWKWKAGHWRVTTQAARFSTGANYDDARGSFSRLPGDNSFAVTGLGLRARYNPSPRLSFYGGGDVAFATAKDAALERSNSAVTGVAAGVDYVLWQNWVRLVAEGEAFYSADQIDVDTTDALTNDGVHHLRATLFAFKPFKWLNAYAHVGLKARDEGLAALLPWGVGLEKPFRRRYLFGAGIEGHETLMSDELPQATRGAVTSRANAGSHAFYAWNPAVIEGRAWAGWSPVNAWQFRVGYGRTFNGVRAAAGQTVFLNLSYNFDPKPDRESFQYHRVRREVIRKKSRKAIEDFKPDPDKARPELFDPEDGFEPDAEPDPLSETQRLLESK